MIHVNLKDKFVQYEFDVRDKYTLLVGDSGCGKTTLHDLITVYYAMPDTVQCSGYGRLRPFPVLREQSELQPILTGSRDFVYVIDEDNPVFGMHGYERLLENSYNYFIIITRDKEFRNLPIALRSIVRLKNSGRYHTFEPVYKLREEASKFSMVITEDSGAGRKFLSQFLKNVRSAGSVLGLGTSGKDCIAPAILECKEDVCVVLDASGIGSSYGDIVEAIRISRQNVTLFAWDSFEGYVIDLPLYQGGVDASYSCAYNSYEQYATAQLRHILRAFPGMNYNKTSLPLCLRKKRCIECEKQSECPYCSYGDGELLSTQLHGLMSSQSTGVIGSKSSVFG